MSTYQPKFLGWCESYEEEERQLRELIDGQPSDVRELRKEYKQLTGKQYRKAKESDHDDE